MLRTRPLFGCALFLVDKPGTSPGLGLDMTMLRLARLALDTIVALRLLWPAHTRKQVARWFHISTETAKNWLEGGVPRGRRVALACAIEHEIPRLEREIQTLERIDGELRAS